MKVELEKLRLGVAAITQDIVVGIPAPDGYEMGHQKVVTNDFIAAIIDLLTPGPLEFSNHQTGEKWIAHLEKIGQ